MEQPWRALPPLRAPPLTVIGQSVSTEKCGVNKRVSPSFTYGNPCICIVLVKQWELLYSRILWKEPQNRNFENLVFISKNTMNCMSEPGKPLKFRHISKNLKYGDVVIQILYYLAFLILAKYKKRDGIFIFKRYLHPMFITALIAVTKI